MTINHIESTYIVPVRVRTTVGNAVISRVIGYKPKFLSKELNDFDTSDQYKECES